MARAFNTSDFALAAIALAQLKLPACDHAAVKRMRKAAAQLDCALLDAELRKLFLRDVESKKYNTHHRPKGTGGWQFAPAERRAAGQLPKAGPLPERTSQRIGCRSLILN